MYEICNDKIIEISKNCDRILNCYFFEFSPHSFWSTLIKNSTCFDRNKIIITYCYLNHIVNFLNLFKVFELFKIKLYMSNVH